MHPRVRNRPITRFLPQSTQHIVSPKERRTASATGRTPDSFRNRPQQTVIPKERRAEPSMTPDPARD
jgi:hypothetical protein